MTKLLLEIEGGDEDLDSLLNAIRRTTADAPAVQLRRAEVVQTQSADIAGLKPGTEAVLTAETAASSPCVFSSGDRVQAKPPYPDNWADLQDKPAHIKHQPWFFPESKSSYVHIVTHVRHVGEGQQARWQFSVFNGPQLQPPAEDSSWFDVANFQRAA